MKKVFSISIILLINIQVISSQNDDKNKFWDYVQFGGGLNLSFGNDITNIGVAPSAIYNFSDQFSAGIGISYLYAKNNDIDISLNAYGGSLISLFNPSEEIQLSAEYEKTLVEQSDFDSRNIDALYLGFGYRVGRNISIGMRYDILYDKDDSIYGSAFSPIARIYF